MTLRVSSLNYKKFRANWVDFYLCVFVRHLKQGSPATTGDEKYAMCPSSRRMPRFREAHHRRVPTPMKRKRTSNTGHDQHFHHLRRHIADPPTPSSDAEDEEAAKTSGAICIPDPYYPIYLPIDQEFKAKYVFTQRKGKTFKEKVYVFLEHPCGWLCFIYHFTV